MRRATPAVSKETAKRFYNEVQKLIDEGLSISGAVKAAQIKFVGTEIDGISYTTAYRIGTARDAYGWLQNEVTVETDQTEQTEQTKQTTEDIVESIKGFLAEEILNDLVEKEIIDETRRNEIYQSFIDNERSISWFMENCSKELAAAQIIEFFNEL